MSLLSESLREARTRLADKRRQEKKQLQQKLLAWYARHARDLPWRRTQNPYYILVSEVMLQQTQVERVIPKYEAFISSLPTLQDLAEVDTAVLLHLWKGLGYHRRALNLRRTAQIILTEYKGIIPEQPTLLQKLPGIGAYTAAAIASFAYGYPIAVYDTNVRRILSRLTGMKDESFLREEAQALLPPRKSRAWNNAIMELGSLVCTKQPACSTCPLRVYCTAAATKDYSIPILPRQSRYEGSWRQYRARLLHILLTGPLPRQAVKHTLNLPEAYDADKLVNELITEGFIKEDKGMLTLT